MGEMRNTGRRRTTRKRAGGEPAKHKNVRESELKVTVKATVTVFRVARDLGSKRAAVHTRARENKRAVPCFSRVNPVTPPRAFPGPHLTDPDVSRSLAGKGEE